MSVNIDSVALIGSGQVGTSILLAFAQQDQITPVTVFDASAGAQSQILEVFRTNGLDPSFITFAQSIEATVNNASLIIIATPMNTFKDIAHQISQFAKPDAIVTDTGSAKAVAIKNILDGLSGSSLHYVPAHPGNGSQGAGPLTASAGNILGRNSTMFLIDDPQSNRSEGDSPLQALENFWRKIGVTTARISTQKHDDFFGQCSHFQHAIVFSLMGLAIDNPAVLDNFKHAGTALRNLSRVAISALKEGKPSALVQMWEPIFDQNQTPIIAAYNRFSSHISILKNLVETEQWAELRQNLEGAKSFRDRFDDPERREIVTGEVSDLSSTPDFNATQKGSLKATFESRSLPAIYTNLMLPYVIAYAQTQSAAEIGADFIAQKANPSFRDGTHPVTYDTSFMVDLLKSNRAEFIKLVSAFEAELKTLTDSISIGDFDYIRKTIINAQTIRNQMPAPRKNDAVRTEHERTSEPT